MSRRLRFGLIIVLLLSSLGAAPASQASTLRQEDPQSLFQQATVEQLSTCDPDGTQASGAIYRICMPPDWWWNGSLMIWAHGYVAYNEPVAIPEDQLCLDNGPCINDIANVLGYGFATTSYSTNGLAIQEGMADVLDLVDIFSQTYGEPNQVLIVGASEGGLVTTLLTEQHSDVFNGGLAVCGPIGNFNYQVNYFGDFRAVFDYFFPGLMPGSPVQIPQWLIDTWDDYYDTNIRPVVLDPANAHTVEQLLRVTKAPFDLADLQATVEESISDALWYNVLGTNDASSKLGGVPFGNQFRWYTGSDDDIALNTQIQRISADPAALAEINAHYQTSGVLGVPLVTMHTLKDQQVPYGHEVFYRLKTISTGSWPEHVNIPVNRYGHCEFTVGEALAAFGLLIYQASGQTPDPRAVDKLLPDAQARSEYRQLLRSFMNEARTQQE
jgi:pimeloyl-ACP methyl ester carboxylesterase